MQIENRPVAELIPYARNARTHSEDQVAQIAASVREFGWTNPILIDGASTIIAGHGRVMAARKLGMDAVPVIVLDHLSEAQKRALIIADNKLALNAGWDTDLLGSELQGLIDEGFEVAITGFSAEEIDMFCADFGDEDGGDGAGEAGESDDKSTGSLAERFLIPPFTVFNAREGWWQNRKRAWLALGIRSEEGRGENLLAFSDTINEPDPAKRKAKGNAGNLTFVKGDRDADSLDPVSAQILEVGQTGTSIFDPVLCEIAYRWFSPQGGLILDPFAGGSVRGVVASKLGRAYIGHELRPEQVAANRVQAMEICADDPCPPAWVEGDSRNIDRTCGDVSADFVFSCPPYADLEVYSDDPADLSTLDYPGFREAYFEIIAKACARLKKDRFAAFVVGDVRDKRGNYYNFVGDTVEAFRAAGLEYYNEAILITAAGSLPIRAGKQFQASRKLGKTHQNVLVFVKGDGKRAAKACGEVECGDPEEFADQQGDGAADSEFGEPL